MKQSLQWHEECMANHARTMNELCGIADRAQREYEASRSRYHFYQQQITEAVRRGMDAFDRDRLLVKRDK
jgi:hypothetical protein